MSHVAQCNVPTTLQFLRHAITSKVVRMHGSCRMYEWVMSHVWMSHVAHVNESCRTYEWVMSHIWMGHVACMNESYHTVWHTYEVTPPASYSSHEPRRQYEWVVLRIWKSHVARMNKFISRSVANLSSCASCITSTNISCVFFLHTHKIYIRESISVCLTIPEGFGKFCIKRIFCIRRTLFSCQFAPRALLTLLLCS